MARGTTARNDRAKQIVLDLIEDARTTEISLLEEHEYSAELTLLEDLIPISAMGFRGVVLTSIVGVALNPRFDPLSNFYQCNPRSIFENGICYALRENGIPCGKSDPLNVAKNIQKLNYDWAQGRRPQSAARAAVDYLQHLRSAHADPARYKTLVRLFFRKLLDYAQYVAQQNAPLVEHEGEPPIRNATRLAAFVRDCPEGGTIPQLIVASLIEFLRQNDARFKVVCGVNESVYGTNTTSKKPADVWEVMSDDEFGALYEITVKTVGIKRLDDCVDNLQALGLTDRVITFFCRIPEDISSLDATDSAIIHRGVRFQFIPIDSFVLTSFCSLPPYDQSTFMHRLEAFVGDSNRPLKTKNYWREHFATE